MVSNHGQQILHANAISRSLCTWVVQLRCPYMFMLLLNLEKNSLFLQSGLLKLTEDKTRGPREMKSIQSVLERVACSWQLSDFVITRSFREVESRYIDYLSTLIGKEVVPTGPLIPDISSIATSDSQEAELVMNWLDQRERRSVVFVSFGSEHFMPYKEMEHLSHGLELSSACFHLGYSLSKG